MGPQGANLGDGVFDPFHHFRRRNGLARIAAVPTRQVEIQFGLGDRLAVGLFVEALPGGEMLLLACSIGLGGHQIGDQLFVPWRIFARHDHCFLHRRMLA